MTDFDFKPLTPLRALADALRTKRTTSEALVETALDRIRAMDGEGPRAFIEIHGDRAIAEARLQDRLRDSTAPPSAVAGIPISIKDLLNEEGAITRAGSRALADQPSAQRDCPVVWRLRTAGVILIGRTNLTEFAYSGLGLNPHFGTPRNPHERDARDPGRGRIPGGSSSGAAISVTDGMAAAAIGTDTGGSVRIPAALCGLAGFKPSKPRISTEGVFQLSCSLDSIGPLAPTIDCCARLDALMAGGGADPVPERPVSRLRVAVPSSYLLEDLDDTVGTAFEDALAKLSAAGAWVERIALPPLAEVQACMGRGGVLRAEAWAEHRTRLETIGGRIDPLIRDRIELGRDVSAADYLDMVWARKRLAAEVDALTAPFDILAVPTVPRVAPTLDSVRASDTAFWEANAAMLRNTSAVNFLDRCAATVPCHEPGGLPVGLMLIGPHGHDRRVLAVAQAVEAVVTVARG